MILSPYLLLHLFDCADADLGLLRDQVWLERALFVDAFRVDVLLTHVSVLGVVVQSFELWQAGIEWTHTRNVQSVDHEARVLWELIRIYVVLVASRHLSLVVLSWFNSFLVCALVLLSLRSQRLAAFVYLWSEVKLSHLILLLLLNQLHSLLLTKLALLDKTIVLSLFHLRTTSFVEA